MATRFRTLALIALATALAGLAPASGCGAFAPNAVGEPCTDDSDCTLRLCGAGVCLDPGRDDDGDGLSNLVEVEWGANPRSIDSDKDGVPDDVEFGSPGPKDTDGDGAPDLVESRLADLDRDCIVDELDSDDEVATADMELVRLLSCPHAGVCAEQLEAISAQCSASVLTCDYSLVVGFEGFAEVACDGVDGDCDGFVDEDFTYGGVQVGGACATMLGCGTGTVVCAPGGVGTTCSLDPTAPTGPDKLEVCDGVDNDCDGATDEGQRWQDRAVGEPCSAGGVCSTAPGVVECHPLTKSAICSTAPGGSQALAAAETCDGADNDCDGTTDEDTVWTSPTGATAHKGEPCGVGVCSLGVVVCDSLGAAACSTDGLRTAERCDGQDNDCDGITDEDITYFGLPLGAPCQGLGACGPGVVECIPNTPVATCSTNANGTQTQATPELCDGIDNDCDGLTDESLALDGVPVGSPCAGSCGEGTVECGATGAVLCSTDAGGHLFAPVAESCNGVDDDCNGAVDDSLPQSWLTPLALPLQPGLSPLPRRSAAAVWEPGTEAVFLVGGTQTMPSSAQDSEVIPWVIDGWRLNVATGIFEELVGIAAAPVEVQPGPPLVASCAEGELLWLTVEPSGWVLRRAAGGAWVSLPALGESPPWTPVACVCVGPSTIWAIPGDPGEASVHIALGEPGWQWWVADAVPSTVDALVAAAVGPMGRYLLGSDAEGWALFRQPALGDAWEPAGVAPTTDPGGLPVVLVAGQPGLPPLVSAGGMLVVMSDISSPESGAGAPLGPPEVVFEQAAAFVPGRGLVRIGGIRAELSPHAEPPTPASVDVVPHACLLEDRPSQDSR